MKKLLNHILCAIVAFSIGVTVHQIQRSLKPGPVPIRVEQPELAEQPHHAEPLSPPTIVEWTSFADLLIEDEAIVHNGYLIKRRYKKVELEENFYEEQGYVVLSKNGKHLRSFDSMAYHPLGNSAEFGLFSFLGTTEKQAAISQDVGRGGKQWVVDLSSPHRVIFDGDAWGVGRESDDGEVKDVDGDGIFEISLPISDFYTMIDKMTVGGVPLPQITFKYDPTKRRYFPVNHILNRSRNSGEPELQKESNNLFFRSGILGHTLELIYEGKRNQAWQYFDRAYNLDDKKEFERRVKNILRDQPVYKFIYKNQ